MDSIKPTKIYYEYLDYSREFVWFHPFVGWCQSYSFQQLSLEVSLDFPCFEIIRVENEAWEDLRWSGALGELAQAGEI